MKKIIYTLFGLLIPSLSYAHVAYVVGEKTMNTYKGQDVPYLLTPFSNPLYVGLMIGTLLLVLIGYGVIKKTSFGKKFAHHTEEVLSSYHEFIPWIIRLSLGIALIGSGVGGVLISPILTNGGFQLTQIILGFCFMSGFLLAPATLIALCLYIFALSQNIYIIGNLDFLALTLGLLVFHSARPGIDDVLGISLLKKIAIPRIYLAPLLRIGIGFGMIFLALYEKLLNPHFMELVINQYQLSQVIPVSTQMWVLATGLIELAIGIFLVLGLYTRTVSIIAIFVLSLTFFYFNESVYSHITLFGTLSILAIENGGLWSLDARRKRKALSS